MTVCIKTEANLETPLESEAVKFDMSATGSTTQTAFEMRLYTGMMALFQNGVLMNDGDT